MPTLITLYEEGDVICMPKSDTEGFGGNVENWRYYIKQGDELKEVNWVEANEYQRPFQKQNEWMKKRKR